jgi:hypothetical protein
MDQLRQKIGVARQLCEQSGRTAPLDICMSAFGHATMKPDARANTAKMLDDYAALAAAGVSWTTVSLPSPTRAAFIEHVQWFGEEVVAKMRSQDH